MRSVLGGALVLLTSISAACAEDSWTGFYAGASLGGSWADFSHVHENQPGNPLQNETVDQSPSGVIGGLQAGYRHQFDSLLLGAQISINAADLSETSTYRVRGTLRERRMTLDHLFTATIEAGYVPVPTWLVSVRGGYAGADIDTFGRNIDFNIYGSEQKWESGWTAGLSVEHLVTDSLSIGASYDYVSINGTDRVTDCVNSACTVGFSDIEADFHTIKANVNYRFDLF